MLIHIPKNYGGHNTNERRILPGEYNSEDPALFGLAQYLVDNGHASVVEGEKPEIQLGDVHTTTKRDVLIYEYETLTGRKPSKNIKTETLHKRVNELNEADNE